MVFFYRNVRNIFIWQVPSETVEHGIPVDFISLSELRVLEKHSALHPILFLTEFYFTDLNEFLFDIF